MTYGRITGEVRVPEIVVEILSASECQVVGPNCNTRTQELHSLALMSVATTTLIIESHTENHILS